MFAKRFLQRLTVVFLLIAILLAGVVAAAAATSDRFYVSRIIAWQESDFRDFEKFSSRAVPAGSNAFSFESAPEKPPEYLRTVTYHRDTPHHIHGGAGRSEEPMCNLDRFVLGTRSWCPFRLAACLPILPRRWDCPSLQSGTPLLVELPQL